MSYSQKIFYSVFVTSFVISSLLSIYFYKNNLNQIEDEYWNRYQTMTRVIENTLSEIERTTDYISKNAVLFLRETIKHDGKIPSNQDLKKYAELLNVTHLYVTDELGYIIRSTETAPQEVTKSLFEFCSDYKNLLHNQEAIEQTPILPSFPYKGPFKFTMIASDDGKHILEAGIHMSFIGKTLQQAMLGDKNIEFIGFFTPSGFELGGVYADGRFEAGGQMNPSDLINERSKENFTIIKKVFSNNLNCCECRMKNIVTANEPYFYYLKTKVSLAPIKNAQRIALLKASVMFFLFMAVAYVVSRLLAKQLVKRIHKMENFLEDIRDLDYASHRLAIDGNDEITNLTVHLNKMMDRLGMAQEKLLESAKIQEYNKLAHQVAHDIRSPLSALSVVMHDLRELPEEKRILVRGAVQRIEDIANDLANKKPNNEVNEGHERHEVCHLSGLIESLISEKRLQYRNKSGLNIEFKSHQEAYAIFVKIGVKEFKRVLSNIINNSVEAMENEGNIEIRMNVKDDDVNMILSDNGKGIPSDIIPKLMKKGSTYGKENQINSGTGLGLFHARETILSFDGDMKISSEMGRGTDVVITLPIHTVPDWFLPELQLSYHTKIVILDDDDSIHQIWNNRFHDIHIKSENIIHFKTTEDIIAWHDEQKKSLIEQEVLFLCDYEILGCDKTGLMVIEKLGISKQAILITSHFEEPEIRKQCEHLGVKLVPKNLSGYVPINISENPFATNTDTEQAINLTPITKNSIEYILIDDDEMIHKTWQIKARVGKKKIATFYSYQDFLKEADDFDRGVPVYIDSDLGDGIKGELVAKEIHEQGFKQIYLATGHSKDDFVELPWIFAIVGKKPPF